MKGKLYGFLAGLLVLPLLLAPLSSCVRIRKIETGIETEPDKPQAEEPDTPETEESRGRELRLEEYGERGFPQWFRTVLCEYFNTSDYNGITGDMLAEIRTVEVYPPHCANASSRTDVRVNGSDISVLYGPYLNLARFRDYEDMIGQQSDWYVQKLNRFYTVKDPNNPLLTERGVKEMREKFPITAERAIAVADPEIKARELRELNSILVQFCADMLVDGMLEDGVLNFETLELLPNLEQVGFCVSEDYVTRDMAEKAVWGSTYDAQLEGLEGKELWAKQDELDAAVEEYRKGLTATDADCWNYIRENARYEINLGYVNAIIVRW